MQTNPFLNIEARRVESTEAVKLRGTLLKGRRSDLPTMIWFSDLVEPVENFASFFNQPGNKILDVRNVWLLNYRNMGDSDHHESFDMQVRKQNWKITLILILITFFCFIGHFR